MNQLDEAIDEANQRLASLVAEEIEKGIQNYVGIAGSERERILVDRVVALHREREEALAENQRLREALRFYGKRENWQRRWRRLSCGCCTMENEPAVKEDQGERARVALEGK